jgi:hypothetical protein
MIFMGEIGELGQRLKSELQIVIGCIAYFENQGGVYEKTWDKMKLSMEKAIVLYEAMKEKLN